MKKALRYGVYGAAFYFGVNWVADNPQAVKGFRSTLNRSVAALTACLNTAIDEVQDALSQSLDK